MPKVIWKTGDDVSTDAIYPGRFMATVLPSETPKFAFADEAGLSAMLTEGNVAEGSILIGGRNFGCGSSREQAASALRGHGLTIVAKSFARIFLQNAINLGLRTVSCPTLEAENGDELEITEDAVVDAGGARFPIEPLPPARRAIVEAGGLIAHTRRRLIEERRTRKPPGETP